MNLFVQTIVARSTKFHFKSAKMQKRACRCIYPRIAAIVQLANRATFSDGDLIFRAKQKRFPVDLTMSEM